MIETDTDIYVEDADAADPVEGKTLRIWKGGKRPAEGERYEVLEVRWTPIEGDPEVLWVEEVVRWRATA